MYTVKFDSTRANYPYLVIDKNGTAHAQSSTEQAAQHYADVLNKL